MPISSDSISQIVENIEDDYMDVLDMDMQILRNDIYIRVRLPQDSGTLSNRVSIYTAVSDMAVMIDGYPDVTEDNTIAAHKIVNGRFIIEIHIYPNL